MKKKQISNREKRRRKEQSSNADFNQSYWAKAILDPTIRPLMRQMYDLEKWSEK